MKPSSVFLTFKIVGCLIATFLILSGVASFVSQVGIKDHDAQYWVCLSILSVVLSSVWMALIIDNKKV